MPDLAIAVASAAFLSAGTRSASGGRPGDTASLNNSPIVAAGLLSSINVSTTSVSDPAAALSKAGLRHCVSFGSKWIVPNR